jgi:hypothetical protein
MELKPHQQAWCIIAEDSRLTDFNNLTTPNSDIYETVNLICRGAGIRTIASEQC